MMKCDVVLDEYMPRVRLIAQALLSRLPSNVELDDLVQAGTIGLIDAVKKFDPKKKNRFITYAEFRIRGAMLDHLRSLDVTPRSIRDKQKQYARAHKDLSDWLGARPRRKSLPKNSAFQGKSCGSLS
ncbi:MAG: sigma-70 family RNA polymerase sigma factor [Bdellovibrionaceae bacterium]|nr:sigma-70 family RNA polymerase sigma factor [Pseudobdellovibrionaceae bacterium]